MKRILIAMAIAAFGAAATASATNLNFAGYSPEGTPVSIISVDGFNFNGGGSTMYAFDSNPNDPNEALILCCGASSLVEVNEGGTPFTLNDLDMTLSWYETDSSDTVVLVGNTLGGGTVDTTLTLGQGLQDYDVDWTNLTSFGISGTLSGEGYWALDNMDVNDAISPVPEPGTWLLMGTGLLGLALFGLRGKWAARNLTTGNLA